VSGVLGAAVRRLRAGGRRSALSAVGIFLAAAMAGVAVTLAVGLGTGFDRAARAADLPDVIARFDGQPRERIDAIIAALPNVEDRAYRVEANGVFLSANGRTSGQGALNFVEDGPRRGYTVVEGRDLRHDRGEVLVEQGLAHEWDLEVGDRIQVGDRRGPQEIAGITVAPDNVAFPLSSAPRVYISLPWLQGLGIRGWQMNQALIWTADPERTDITLQQARATTADVDDLRFITRSGVRVLIDGAAGVVIALLGAFSLIALGAACVMLAAQAAADVQRRLASIGVQRAIGFSRGRVAGEFGLAAALLALVAGGAGIAAGALAVARPSGRLLAALNELPPGAALLPWLGAALAGIVALVGLAAAWPAWRATGRPPVELLRGAELRGALRRRRAGGRRIGGPAGFGLLGARLALARRGRALLAVAVLGVSGALILLMLGLASLVETLRDDPGSLGKRYDLEVRLPAEAAADVREIPGVEAASPRYMVRGADSYALGEPVQLIGIPGDRTEFEDPPLAEGREARGPGEAVIGIGLASALGVRPGGTLAAQLEDGGEVRFRVVGTVRALEDDGRIAYVDPERLLEAAPGLDPRVVVRLAPDADEAAVTRELRALGAEPAAVGGATTQSDSFLVVLANLLRVVAALDVLVCLYALVQALALTARERRPTLALLRATGAPARTIAVVLAGAALALAVPAALLAIPVERFLLAPGLSRLAAGYADLGGGASPGAVAGVVLAFAALALVAAAWVARRTVAEPPVAGLREE
jgi:ABC-type lipoprotein release transport system permease subunit